MITHTIGNYVAQRYSFLKLVEGDVLWAYADSKGIPTIGVGLNLKTHGELVLKALGFDLGGSLLQGAAFDAEQEYARQILSVIRRPAPFPATANPFTDSNNAVMQALSPILQARAQNSLLLAYDSANFTSYDAYAAYQFGLSGSFRLGSSTISAELLRLVLDDGYTVPGVDGIPVSFNGGYEKLLDTWLNTTDVGNRHPALRAHDSNERLALLSLAFNSRTYESTYDNPTTTWHDGGLPTLLGPSLTRALLNDDRAEAWYEIRYDSNAGGGHASRRFKESDLFNLYNDASNVVEDDAKTAYRMHTRHADTIDLYERQYWTALPQNKWINDQLQPATQYLSATFAAPYGVSVSWNNIQVGETLLPGHPTGTDADTLTGTQYNDLIFGETGLDTLKGGGGDDVLYGGNDADFLSGQAGNDFLLGGSGTDTYYYESGGGQDTINDTDGLGRILYRDAAGNLIAVNGGEKTPETGLHQSRDVTHNINYTWSGVDGQSLLITFTDNPAGTLTVQNFKNGDLGIFLDTALSQYTAATALGGSAGHEVFGAGANHASVYAGAGNDLIIGSGRWNNDPLPPTAYNNRLYGEAGNDWLYGGAGRDALYGGDDHDMLQGGSGADALYGGDGNDILLSDTSAVPDVGNPADNRWTNYYSDWTWSASDLYAGPNQIGSWGYDFRSPLGVDLVFDDYLLQWVDASTTRAPSDIDFLTDGVQDEILDGGAGNDLLVGSPGNDFLDGGTDDDKLIGDAGRDTLLGGSGNDQLAAGAGDDFVSGGPESLTGTLTDDDKLWGEAGNDTLVGGAGLDIIEGDYAYLDTTLHGNDYIDGGSGNDFLYGQGGNDTLLGGAGNDMLWGDLADPNATLAGNDYLHGGTGNDWLLGGAGSDTYVFNLGDGVDVIQENSTDLTNIDTLVLGPGIDPNQVGVYRVVTNSGADLDLALAISATDTLWVKNYFTPGNGNKVEQIKFADGTLWGEADISAKLAAPRTQPGSPLNNIYTVTSQEDTINELPDGGIDTVLSPVSYALSQNVENLTLTGGMNVDGTGNELDNTITGNDANNILAGLAGNDTMIGNGGALQSNVTYRWLTQRIPRQHSLMQRAA